MEKLRVVPDFQMVTSSDLKTDKITLTLTLPADSTLPAALKDSF